MNHGGVRDSHGENSRSATNIKHDLVLEKVLVLQDGIHVGLGSNFIFLNDETMSWLDK